MDGNNWRAAQAQGGGGEGAGADAGAMDSGDWRTQLLPDSRQSIVNKIMETLKRHLPVSGQEGVQELKKIAVRFEEKIYSAATSQQDYLQKISLKMLTMETKSQNPIQPNPASSGQNPVQQQMLQNTTTLLPSQGQQSQLQPAQQQMMSQSQSQPGQLPPPLGLQQQTNQLQREMQQRLQLSAPLLQQQNVMEQQKQLYQSRAAEASSTSLDSTAQTGNANAADWQEEVYQKIKSMRDSYLAELNDLYHKIASEVQQHDSLPQRPQNEQIDKLKVFKVTLERIVLFLQLNKQDIQPSHKEKLVSVEKHISFFLSSNNDTI